MRGWRLGTVAGIALILLYFMRTSPPPEPLYELAEPKPVDESLARDFDPSRTGSLVVRVNWSGDVPVVSDLKLAHPKVHLPDRKHPRNPNAPRISKDNRLADVVVMLKGVDLRRSRPWHHPAPTVEIAHRDLQIKPSLGQGQFGVVRRGTAVEMVSREMGEYSIRGRGAAYFNQMLFAPNQPVNRIMPNAGIVELSCAAWYYWMNGYLVVSDHPYVGVTNVQGEVSFEQVPDGEYEIVCWKANWHIAEIERDREWLGQTGIVYQPAAKKQTRVQVINGQTTSAVCAFRFSDFAASK